jgi:hypothetical protein
MTFSDALSREIRAELARRQMSRGALIASVREASSSAPSQAQLYRMIRGEYGWDVDTLEEVAKVLEVSVGDLINRAATVNRCSVPSLSASVNPQVSALPVPA